MKSIKTQNPYIIEETYFFTKEKVDVLDDSVVTKSELYLKKIRETREWEAIILATIGFKVVEPIAFFSTSIRLARLVEIS